MLTKIYNVLQKCSYSFIFMLRINIVRKKLNNIIRFILFWSNYIDGNIVIDVYDKLKKKICKKSFYLFRLNKTMKNIRFGHANINNRSFMREISPLER